MYIRYFFSATHGGRNNPDAPFINELFDSCLKYRADDHNMIAETIREQAFRSDDILEVVDHGSGTRKHLPPARPVRKIMKQTAIDSRSGQVLAKLAAKYRPRMILELGTGLGISTIYLAGGNPDARLVTIEGSMEIAQRASANFRTAGLKKIELITGTFSEVLPSVLFKADHPLMVVIDGDHREKSLLDNISLLMPVLQDDSIVAVDDIHLSPGMNRAWKKTISMPEVRLSIDLFRMGLLFFSHATGK